VRRVFTRPLGPAIVVSGGVVSMRNVTGARAITVPVSVTTETSPASCRPAGGSSIGVRVAATVHVDPAGCGASLSMAAMRPSAGETYVST
jgi:hypothetical protein